MYLSTLSSELLAAEVALGGDEGLVGSEATTFSEKVLKV